MTRLAPTCALGLLAYLLFFGCGREHKAAPGEEYFVSEMPRPALVGNALKVTLGYGGCSGDGPFAMRHRMEDGTAKLWLWKLPPHEPCDMAITEPRTFDLPAEARGATRIVLVTPAGQAYVLRDEQRKAPRQ